MYSAYQSGQASSCTAGLPLMLAMCGGGAPQRGRKLGRRVELGLVRIDAAGQPLGDFLQQPEIAVGIGEGRKRRIALPLRVETSHAAARAVAGMEDVADLDALRNELGARRLMSLTTR